MQGCLGFKSRDLVITATSCFLGSSRGFTVSATAVPIPTGG